MTPNEERYPKRLPRDGIIDEISLYTKDRAASFHLFIEERWKSSWASGSEWRFRGIAEFYWKGNKIATWVDGIHYVEGIAKELPRLVDSFLYKKPRTKRDDRLDNYKYLKEYAEKGMCRGNQSSSDEDEVNLEDETTVAKFHDGDDEIAGFEQTSYRLPDRHELLEIMESATTCPTLECRRKGKILVNKEMSDKSMIRSLLYTTFLEDDSYTFDDEKLCFQIGCKKTYTVEFTISKEYSNGDEIKRDGLASHFRRFCNDHRARGSADFEDCGENYKYYSGEVLPTSEPLGLQTLTAQKIQEVKDFVDKTIGPNNYSTTDK